MDIDLVSLSEKESAGVVTASGFSDEWYLNAYKINAVENKFRASMIFGHSFGGRSWRKIALASLLGIFAGLGIASRQIGLTAPIQSERPIAVQAAGSGLNAAAVPRSPITPAVVPPASRVATSNKGSGIQSEEDVARLKLRNRRLEALVKALRQRSVEKRSVQEQTTYLGQ